MRGTVAWFVAARRPEWLSRLVILNMPHPAVMRRTLFRSRRQLRRSQYILFFQIPLLPEWLLARDDYRALTVTLQRSSRPGAFSEDDLDRYRTAYDQPGALAGMLSWYRASVLDPLRWMRAGRPGSPGPSRRRSVITGAPVASTRPAAPWSCWLAWICAGGMVTGP